MSGTPLRVGLIGCGGILRAFHAAAYQSLPSLVRISALADPVPAHLQWARETLQVPAQACHADFKAMLAAETLDVVVVATPHALHGEQSIAALQHGVDVISEKPMALTLEDADRILAVAEKTGQTYTVVHNFLFTPGTAAALARVRGGDLGPTGFGRTRALFRKQADQADPAQVWRASRAAGGGCINDTLYHEIYLTEALVNFPVRYVQAQVLTQHFDFEVDDMALLLLEHANGAVSTVSGSWWVTGSGNGENSNLAEVHGHTGSVRILRRGRELFQKRADAPDWQEVPLTAGHESARDRAGWSGHAGYFAHTFAALARHEAPPVSGLAARGNLAIITAARMATTARQAIRPDTL